LPGQLPGPTKPESERRTIVAAFGGNAVTQARERGSYSEQLANVRVMCEEVLPLIEAGHRVVIIHGNGPQVGALALQVEAGRALGVPDQPFDVLGAMTQGQIGYLIQQTMRNIVTQRREVGGPATWAGTVPPVASIVTQVLVDPADPAFQHPTKPIGPFYDRDLAESLAAEKGWTVVQDSDRGWRRVVPSPQPIEVIEAPAIRALIAAGAIVVAGGGGGVPVVREPGGTLRGVEAVIDKDLTSALMARVLGIEAFLILTEVRRVAIHWGTPRQRDIERATPAELRAWQREGHFPEGSMGPKVEAACRFVEGGGRRAVIARLEEALPALRGETGTQVVPGGDA